MLNRFKNSKLLADAAYARASLLSADILEEDRPALEALYRRYIETSRRVTARHGWRLFNRTKINKVYVRMLTHVFSVGFVTYELKQVINNIEIRLRYNVDKMGRNRDSLEYKLTDKATPGRAPLSEIVTRGSAEDEIDESELFGPTVWTASSKTANLLSSLSVGVDDLVDMRSRGRGFEPKEVLIFCGVLLLIVLLQFAFNS